MKAGAPAARPTSGLVLEVTPDTVFVLTREGIFLEVPRRDIRGDAVVGATISVELGAEWFASAADHAPAVVEAPAPVEAPAAVEAPTAAESLPAVEVAVSRRRRLSGLWRSWHEAVQRRRPAVRALGAAAAALVLLGLGLGLYQQHVAAYQVAVEINPAIILEVNAFDRVVRSRAANADGEAVLRALDPRGMTVAEAVRALVATLKDLGFLPAPALQPLSAEATPLEAEAGASAPGAGDPAEAEPDAGPTAAPGPETAELDVPGPTLAISIIAPSGTRTGADGAAVAQALEDSLRDAASETGTVFDAVVQVVSADELARARQKTPGDGSIAKAVLAEKARARGVELSDDEITRASVPDLARMVGQQPAAGDDGQEKYQVHFFRVQPRNDDGDDDGDDRRGGSARGNGARGRDRDNDEDDDQRARGAGRNGGRGNAAGRWWGAGDDDDDSGRGGQGGGRSDRGRGDHDDDRGRRNNNGRGVRDDRGDDDESNNRRSSRDRDDDDRRSDRGNSRGRGNDDDDDGGSGRGRSRGQGRDQGRWRPWWR